MSTDLNESRGNDVTIQDSILGGKNSKIKGPEKGNVVDVSEE